MSRAIEKESERRANGREGGKTTKLTEAEMLSKNPEDGTKRKSRRESVSAVRSSLVFFR